MEVRAPEAKGSSTEPAAIPTGELHGVSLHLPVSSTDHPSHTARCVVPALAGTYTPRAGAGTVEPSSAVCECQGRPASVEDPSLTCVRWEGCINTAGTQAL